MEHHKHIESLIRDWTGTQGQLVDLLGIGSTSTLQRHLDGDAPETTKLLMAILAAHPELRPWVENYRQAHPLQSDVERRRKRVKKAKLRKKAEQQRQDGDEEKESEI